MRFVRLHGDTIMMILEQKRHAHIEMKMNQAIEKLFQEPILAEDQGAI